MCGHVRNVGENILFCATNYSKAVWPDIAGSEQRMKGKVGQYKEKQAKRSMAHEAQFATDTQLWRPVTVGHLCGPLYDQSNETAAAHYPPAAPGPLKSAALRPADDRTRVERDRQWPLKDWSQKHVKLITAYAKDACYVKLESNSLLIGRSAHAADKLHRCVLVGLSLLCSSHPVSSSCRSLTWAGLMQSATDRKGFNHTG